MDAHHLLITGRSGHGKSTLGKQTHAEFDGVSAYLTPKTRDREGGITGKEVRGRKALRTAITDADDVSNVRVKWYDANYPEDLETVREWAIAVRRQTGQPVQIIVDEAQKTQLSKSKGPLKEGLHEDRDLGIKWVMITQSPQDLKESRGYPGVNQCKAIVWVGEDMTFQEGFINFYHLDDAQDTDGTVVGLPNEKYRYHVIKPSRPPVVLYQGETDPRYG